MIRKWAEKYLEKHPPKLEKRTWHPAKNPWQLAVTILTAEGDKDFVDIIDYDQDYYRDEIGTYEYWDRAKRQAEDDARKILKKGYTVEDDPAKDYYPLHRVHLVQTYPKPQEDVTVTITADSTAVEEALDTIKDGLRKVDQHNL